MDIGLGAKAGGVAVEDAFAKLVDGAGDVDLIAFAGQAAERCMKRFEHRKELRRARRAGIGREVEQDDGDALCGLVGAAQLDHPQDARGQHVGALGTGLHRADRAGVGESAAARAAGAGRVRAVGAAAEHHRHSAAIKLGDRDHHRRFERQQPLAIGTPALQRLEFDRVGRNVGTIELGEDVLRQGRVIISRAADQAETG